MQPWKRIEPSIPVKVGWRDVTVKTFIGPNGKPTDFTVFGKEGAEGACIIAITKKGKVVVSRQFRTGPELIFDEIPGGGVEPGEDPKLAAIRELEEETGYKALVEHTKYLGKVYKDAVFSETMHYFLAYNCTPTGVQALEEHELAEVILVNIGQLIKNAKEGRMTDSSAVLLAYEELQDLQKKYEQQGE